jgi:hypothetical protein
MWRLPMALRFKKNQGLGGRKKSGTVVQKALYKCMYKGV